MPNTKLRNVSHISDSLLSDQLEANITSYLQWAFLAAGGFFNVNLDSSMCYGGEPSVLRAVSDPNSVDGSVWEGFRKDWVWESGVEYHTQPIAVSGVYVNGTFRPLASGVTVNYPNGTVTLDPPVSPTSTVACEYSYRLYQVYTVESPTWRQIQENSFRVDDPQFRQTGSGIWDVLAANRVQLPAIFLEAVPETHREGLELGGYAQKVKQTVLFNILAEDKWHSKWLHDALTYQEEATLEGYDKNMLLQEDKFPLDMNGSPVPSGLMYPSLLSAYPWKKIHVARTQSVAQPKVGGLNLCTVRWTTETNI